MNISEKKMTKEEGSENHPIIVNEDIQKNQADLVESLARKKMKISALKIELSIAKEKVKEMNGKLVNKEG